MRIVLTTLTLLILVGMSVAAPTILVKRPTVNDWIGGMGRSTSGLIDPSRLTINHGMSFGASFGGGNSLMSGLYQTNFLYRLSNPLTLSLSLGMQNLKYSGNPTSQSSILAGFGLDYRPTKNLHFRVQMQQMPFGSYRNNNLNRNLGSTSLGTNFLMP